MAPRQRQQTYYGYAFESYCTSDTPTRQPPRQHQHQQDNRRGTPFGWGGDVNTNVQWCSVVRTKLGDTRIVIGGEVDCVKGLIFLRCGRSARALNRYCLCGQSDILGVLILLWN